MCAQPQSIYKFLCLICHLLHINTKQNHRIQYRSNQIRPVCHQLVFPWQFNHLRRKCESISLLPILIQNYKGVSEPNALLHAYRIYLWWFWSCFSLVLPWWLWLSGRNMNIIIIGLSNQLCICLNLFQCIVTVNFITHINIIYQN